VPSQWLIRWTSISQGIVQIAFFVITGVVAILSYIRAKKTLFQPLRTEVFKEQLKILTKILDQFEGKTEGALLDDFGLEELIDINVISLLDEYANCVLKQDIDIDEQPYSKTGFAFITPGPKESSGWGELKHRGPIRSDIREEPSEPVKWDQYWRFCVYLPKKFQETIEKLDRLMGSPLVPTGCLTLLRDYKALAYRNLGHIQTALTETAQILPEHYPTLKDLKKADTGFIHSLILGRIEKLEPAAKKIIDFSRGYLDPDRLFK
jgi:hypothetical protein